MGEPCCKLQAGFKVPGMFEKNGLFVGYEGRNSDGLEFVSWVKVRKRGIKEQLTLSFSKTEDIFVFSPTL